MKFHSFLVILVALAAPVCVHAGHEQGNGGDAIVCLSPAGTIHSVGLLDLYEATAFRQLTLLQPTPEMTFEDIVTERLVALSRVAPKRAALYQQWFSTFQNDTLFLTGVHLPLIPDADPLFIPNGCELRQLAVNRVPELPTDKIYLINNDLWILMSEFDKAGLILHEMIYREMVALGETNSLSSRYFNGILHSTLLATLDQKAFVGTMHGLGIPHAEYRGWILDLKAQRPCFGPRCGIQSAVLYGVQNYMDGPSGAFFPVTGKISWDQNDKILVLNIGGKPPGSVLGNFFGESYNLGVGHPIELYPDGRLAAFWMEPNQNGVYESPDYRLVTSGLFPGDKTPFLVRLTQDGKIFACERCQGHVMLQNRRIEITASPKSYTWVGDYGWLPADGSIVYSTCPSFPIRSLVIKSNTSFSLGGPGNRRDITFLAGTTVRFSNGADCGKLLYGILAANTRQSVQGKEVLFQGGTRISFWGYWDSPVSGGVLAEGIRLLDQDGNVNFYAAGLEVHFNGDGEVQYSQIPDPSETP